MSGESSSEPALVQGITLCDWVIREHMTGKCTLVGTFHGFYYHSFPAPARFWIHVAVTNLRVFREMNLTCRLEHADNGFVISNVSAKVGPPPGVPQDKLSLSPLVALDIPFPFGNVVVPAPGAYSIVVLLEGDEIGRRRIEAVQMPMAPTQGKVG